MMNLKTLRELVNAIPTDKDEVLVMIGYENDYCTSQVSEVHTVAIEKVQGNERLIIADSTF
jgi:hypothetical protein